MFAIGPIAFVSPWLLLGLIALPILWLILRAVPPAPIVRRFPGVALLLGLTDPETETDKTPWWLLLLRALAVAAMIIGFAGPLLNPEDEGAGDGPLLIVADGSWASARDWPARRDRIESALREAARLGRPVALVSLTDLPPEPPRFQPAEAVLTNLPGFRPAPFEPAPDAVAAWAGRLESDFDTLWISDGVERESRAELIQTFEARGKLRVVEGLRTVLALRPASIVEGAVEITAVRSPTSGARNVRVLARGPDPSGVQRVLARLPLTFEEGAGEAVGQLQLPSELRNRITKFEIEGHSTAGAVSLTDDTLQRREIALYTGRDGSEGLELLEPLHYLRRALAPTADLLELPLSEVLPANPDVIILADVAQLAEVEAEGITEWVENGGLLLRFAGPRLAASNVARTEEDPLLPVRLRAGGRSVGGAMSWGEPKDLRAFAEGSPFFGLQVPPEVTVTAQVMAQPDPDLPNRVIASLADGTPLVTRKALGQGQVVLMHVTANAEWSSLPLSVLFVQMLERLAVSTRPTAMSAEALVGTTWIPDQRLGAFGQLEDAGTLQGVPGENLVDPVLNAELPPGLYVGGDRRLALNVAGPDTVLGPAAWPGSVVVEGIAFTEEQNLTAWLLGAALMLLALDIFAALALSGRLRGPRAAAVVAFALAMVLVSPQVGQAQDNADDAFALAATADVVLAHVLTGDRRLDEAALVGLTGLSQVLFRRTSIEPAPPVSINLELDELSFFPFLYWPVTPDQPLPSAEAYAKLNRYLRTGGMILFDTRDADIAVSGRATDGLRGLQRLAASLDIPPLERIPGDHVLTRTFYLLQDFPGRYAGRNVWVEAAPDDAEQIEGMPFRNLNDGVTPVVIGGNDWASAWAVDEMGRPMFPVGRGFSGRQQRELAYRFGVNLIMHVLTGNYKSDQVHVPALLERLGQ